MKRILAQRYVFIAILIFWVNLKSYKLFNIYKFIFINFDKNTSIMHIQKNEIKITFNFIVIIIKLRIKLILDLNYSYDLLWIQLNWIKKRLLYLY